MFKNIILLLALFAITFTLGCEKDDKTEDQTAGAEAGSEGGAEAGSEGGAEAGAEAGSEAGSEGGAIEAVDCIGSDAGTDCLPEADMG